MLAVCYNTSSFIWALDQLCRRKDSKGLSVSERRKGEMGVGERRDEEKVPDVWKWEKEVGESISLQGS